MEIFLEITRSSIAKLDPAEGSSRGWTAMDHLEFRANAEELREPFLRVLLAHVEVARQRYQRVSHPSFHIKNDPVHVIEELMRTIFSMKFLNFSCRFDWHSDRREGDSFSFQLSLQSTIPSTQGFLF
jgi:hypothetical protein